MRTIKFRGKIKTDGKWIIGTYFNLHHNDERKHIHHFIIPDNTPIPKERSIGEIQVEIDLDTLGQFTGLYDKNGKEIYEGDIVCTKYGRICEIYWFKSEGDNGWDLNPIEWKNKAPDQYDLFLSENLEVIGNIHDNPELLKGK